MKLKRVILLLIAAAFVFAFAACAKQPGGPENDGKIELAVTILPQQTFVEAVCGELASVTLMVPPGYSPEHYEPTPQDMAKFSDAAIYFGIGLPIEETSVYASLSDSTRLVRLDEVCREHYNDLEIDGGRDPHIWLSARRAAVMVQAIAEEMSLFDPDNAETYAANAALYIEEISEASAQIDEMLSGLSQRSFIVFHPAFSYFANEYDLNMYALEEHGKEATISSLMEMIDLAKREGIKTIFYQAESDSSQSAAFAEEIGGRAVMLDPLSGDYIGNLKKMAQAIAEGAG